MSSRNATASWSGFSHQGKVGLLVALKKINELNLVWGEEYILDYEQQEDARILLDGEPIEVHQVKARSSGNTIGTYTDTLENFEPCEGGNFLHTIVDIHNWGNLTQDQNRHNVERYNYGNDQFYCPLNEIQEKIIAEIYLILKANKCQNAENEDYHYRIYETLLAKIDELVRAAHYTQDYRPSITLNEILILITDNPVEYSIEIFNLRKRLFGEFEQYIYDIDLNNDPIEEDLLGTIRSKIESIYCLPDREFEQFLRNINPHKTGGLKVGMSNIDQFFSSNSFSSVFLVVLQDVIDEELNINTESVPYYHKSKKFVLTTINDDERRKLGHARRIIENREIDFSEFETDFLITENFSGKLVELVKPNKQVQPDEGELSDSNKYTSPKEMTFIPKKEAIEKLNN